MSERPKHYTELQVQTVCLVIVTAFAIGMGLYLLRAVLVPFMLAVFLAFMITPVLDLQTRYLRIPRVLALFITLLITMGVLSIVVGITVSSLTQLASNANKLQSALEQRVREGMQKLPFEKIGVTPTETRKISSPMFHPPAPGNLFAPEISSPTARETEPASFSQNALPGDAAVVNAENPDATVPPNTGKAEPAQDSATRPPDSEVQPGPGPEADSVQTEIPADEILSPDTPDVPDQFDPMSFLPEDMLGWMLTQLTAVLTTIASQGVLVLLFVIFLLLGRAAQPRLATGVGLEIERSVKRYVITKVIVSTLTGLFVFAALNILGVRFAMAFGALAFLLNFIPSVGSIIATLLPVPVLLLMPDVSTTTFVLAILIPGSIQFTIGNLIEPKLLGDSLDLHPVVILLALIFWGMIWGPIGMLLAAPLTAIAKIVLSKIELTQPMADALGGRIGGLL